MAPPPVGARVIIWAAEMVSESVGTRCNPRMVRRIVQAEYRGVVTDVDADWVRLDTSDRVRVGAISSWREEETWRVGTEET